MGLPTSPRRGSSIHFDMHQDGESLNHADALIGATVSRYRILARLGQGGMGVVYRALDTSLEREVALKFLPLHLTSDQESERRFVLEAKAVSALDHPHIAVVHEIDRAPDGRLFMAMAYYRGETLRQRIRRGPQPVHDAVRLARQIAEGLRRAHEEGIIHRDVKPENIIVTDQGLAKILDFGLAKVQDVNLTVTGTSMGTLAYMAPEQAFGGTVDHRADLWALGVILYEMLTGNHPFLAPGAAQASVLYTAANEQHTPVLSIRPDAPLACSGIIDTLLQKDPANRYPTTDHLVRDLADAETDDGGVAETVAFQTPRPPGRRENEAPAAPIWKRSPLALGAIATTLVLIAAISWTIIDRDTVVQQDAHLQARTHLNDGLDFFASEQYNLARTELERAVELDPTYSAAWSSLAAANIQLGRFDAAAQHSRTAVQWDSLNATAYFNLALALEESGQGPDAAEAYHKAFEIDPGFVQAYSALGNLYTEMGRTEEALVVLSQAASLVPQSELMFLIYKNMGKAYLAQGTPETAREWLTRSASLNESWPETIALMAETYHELGREAESRQYMERYLEVETDPARRETLVRRLTVE